MFVVFSVNPYYGHFHPLAPLASVLQERGHRVSVATWAGFHDVVYAAGLRAVPAGIAPFMYWAWSLEVIRSKTRDLRALARRDRPQLIVREITDFGGLIAAEALDVPCVTVGAGLYIVEDWWRTLLDGALDQVRREHGLALDPRCARLHPQLYLDVVPPWFQDLPYGPFPGHLYMDGGASPEGPGRPPLWLSELPPRPLVYVTLGTVYNQRPRLLARIVDAVAADQVNVICTVGVDQDPRSVFPRAGPPNVRVLRYLPQSHVLRRSRVTVSHGGYNTVIGALRHGVLPLVIPLGSDHQVNAQRCVDLGIGASLSVRDATRPALREAVHALLDDSERRLRLRRLQDGKAPAVSLAHAAELLEALAASGRGRGDGAVTAV